jgi:hypothetical protein
MKNWRVLGGRNSEAGGIADAIPAIIIGVLVIGGCIWLAFNYASSTGSEAENYAREVVQKLTVDHDANFLTRNLSQRGRIELGPISQQTLIENFVRLGQPQRPFKLKGNVTYRSQSGAKEPVAHYQTTLRYPNAEGQLDLVARRYSRWEIDSLSVQWSFPAQAEASAQAQTPVPTPAPTAAPTTPPPNP